MGRLVQTDMGNAGAQVFGLEKAPTTLEQSSKNTADIVCLLTCIATIIWPITN